MDKKNERLTEEQPAPTGMMAWVGFGFGVFSLAALCMCFVSPYWLQTWPMSQNPFKNIGLWHVCFHNYMQFKDDSQQIYDGCWWVFDSAPKYYKLREWLIPPWFIACQVFVVGCLIVQIATCLVMALIFLHCCPIMNHEYLQTYGVFASASMMFLTTMITFVVGILFGVKCNDRYWLPRPDQNFLSWGFGFLIICGICSCIAGICLFMEAQRTYNELLLKEDEYTKQALEMSTYQLEPLNNPPSYFPGSESEPDNTYPSGAYYDKPRTPPTSSGGYVPEKERPASYVPGMSFGQPSVASRSNIFPLPPPTGPTTGKSFQLQNEDGDDFV